MRFVLKCISDYTVALDSIFNYFWPLVNRFHVLRNDNTFFIWTFAGLGDGILQSLLLHTSLGSFRLKAHHTLGVSRMLRELQTHLDSLPFQLGQFTNRVWKFVEMTVSCGSLSFEVVEIGERSVQSVDALALFKVADGWMPSSTLQRLVNFLQFISVDGIGLGELSRGTVGSLGFTKEILGRFWVRRVTGRPVHLHYPLIDIWIVTIFVSASVAVHLQTRIVSVHVLDHHLVLGVGTAHLIDALELRLEWKYSNAVIQLAHYVLILFNNIKILIFYF